MDLSADEVPINIISNENRVIILIVNNPKFKTSHAPVIVIIVHTIFKKMNVSGQRPSFLILEEAQKIGVLNMHCIPAALRGFIIATVYRMQNPTTAKYYECYFETIKDPAKSVSRGHNLDFDTRITREK